MIIMMFMMMTMIAIIIREKANRNIDFHSLHIAIKSVWNFTDGYGRNAFREKGATALEKYIGL
jgi:hypothetical protein